MSESAEQHKVVELSGTLRPAPFGPTKCAMPNLSGLSDRQMLNYVLNAMFRGAGPSHPESSAYLRAFIMATDKTIYEYEAARSAFEEFVVTRNRLSLYIRTTAHLETCILSARRALRFVDRLRRSLDQQVLSRTDWRAIQAYTDSVREFRDIIEHMDDEIANGNFAANGYFISLALSPDGDAVSVGDRELTFSRLALLLERLYSLTSLLSDYHEPRQQNQTAST